MNEYAVPLSYLITGSCSVSGIKAPSAVHPRGHAVDTTCLTLLTRNLPSHRSTRSFPSHARLFLLPVLLPVLHPRRRTLLAAAAYYAKYEAVLLETLAVGRAQRRTQQQSLRSFQRTIPEDSLRRVCAALLSTLRMRPQPAMQRDSISFQLGLLSLQISDVLVKAKAGLLLLTVSAVCFRCLLYDRYAKQRV